MFLTPSGMVMHFLAYGVWMGVAWFTFPAYRVHMIGVGLALGLILEGVQKVLPYRTFNPVDAMANVTGILLAIAIVRLLRSGQQYR